MEGKERRAIIEEWKVATLNDFTSFLETNSGTADAVNLSVVQKLLRFNLPVIIENAGKKFVEGETDELPICVWMQWKGTDFLDRLLGKPKMIKEVKLFMGNRSVDLVTVAELEQADKFSEKEPRENLEGGDQEVSQEKDEGDQKSFAA
jgi:hypothetical protein